jgi:tetratricopeptide (TPR) repeat protein
MKFLLRLMILVLVACGGWLGWEVVRANHNRTAAARSIARENWAQARLELARYLRLRPGDSQARLMFAESYARDDSLSAELSAKNAIEQLQCIPDSVPVGARARTQEGRLRFLILNQPIRAESLFRRAIELDDGNYDAHFMLWKLLDMTGRSHLTETLFWRVYELSPALERPLRLREWYLSEFSPGSENAPFDRSMGFLEEAEKPGALVDFRRLQQFTLAEPESPIAGAAVARLFLRENLREKSRETLDQIDRLDGAYSEPYYIATRIQVLLECGEFDDVEECFKRWPEPRSGFEFWKFKAIILDEIRRDNEAAVEEYDRALEVWPGRDDWQLMFRKAHCLNRLGKKREADEVRNAAARVEKLMERDVHVGVRQALGHLDDPAAIATVVDFYRKLGRTRESQAWEEHRQQLIAALQSVLSAPKQEK